MHSGILRRNKQIMSNALVYELTFENWAEYRTMFRMDDWMSVTLKIKYETTNTCKRKLLLYKDVTRRLQCKHVSLAKSWKFSHWSVEHRHGPWTRVLCPHYTCSRAVLEKKHCVTMFFSAWPMKTGCVQAPGHTTRVHRPWTCVYQALDRDGMYTTVLCDEERTGKAVPCSAVWRGTYR